MKIYLMYLSVAALLLLASCKKLKIEKVYTTCKRGCYTGYDIVLYNNDSAVLRYWSDIPENCESRGHYKRKDSLLIIDVKPTEDEFCTYNHIVLIEKDSLLIAQQTIKYGYTVFYRREIAETDYPPKAILIKE
jgi:hypothetical protein